jgi:excisionase family DNA binding protein
MDYLTLDEVCTILKVHINTVYSYISSGNLKAFKLNGNGPWRVSKSDLEDFVSLSLKGGA